MKTSKSHSRGDHVMERFHSAKHIFCGSWRCQPCAGDFVSPVSRAQKHRGQKKNRKDPNFDPDFVESNKKVSEKEDRRDPNFDPEFVKSSQTAPAREDRKGSTNFTKSSQPTAAKPYSKGRSLRSFLEDSKQPKAREDHLLLENPSLRKEEDAEGNRKGESGKINEQLQPTHLEDGNELKTQDENAKNLEGRDAKVPSPTDLPETESLKHSEPVNNPTISDEAAAKETPRKGSQSHQGQVNGEVQPMSQEDRHELEFPNEDKEDLEEKDAVPSHTGLEKSESSNQAEQVSSSSVSSEVVGKENEHRADSPSQRADMNGQLPPTHLEDGSELKTQDENAKNLEGKDAKVPSPTDLPETESLKHSEPVNNTTNSDEAAAKETPRKSSQSHQGQVNGEVQPKSQEDRHEQEFPNEDKEEKDAVPSHTGLEKSESLNQAEQVSSSSVSSEVVGKENEHRADSPSQRADMNGQLPPTHLEDGSELKTQDENAKNLEGKDAKVPSPADLPETESLKHSEPVNNTTNSDEAAAKETPRKSSQSHQGQVNGEVQPKSQEDRHEQEFPNEDKEEKDAVPSHTGLGKSESLNQAEQVSSSSVSSEVVGKENEHRADSPSQRADMNGQLPPTHLEDGSELKTQDENAKNLEGKDAKVPSPADLPETESLKHSEPVNNTTNSDEAAAKETPRKSSQSHQGQVNGEVQPKSQEDRHEQEFPNEDKEEKDAVPSHTGLGKSESLNQAEQVSSSSVSSEVVGKENEHRADSPSQRADMNGQLPPTHREDGSELKTQDENAKNLEGKDAKVPSPTDLPETESLKHSEPVNNTTNSDEAAAKETPRKSSQSHQGQVNGEVQPKSQEDRHEQEFPNEDKEEKDAVPSHTGLEKSESLNQAEQVSSSSVSSEVVGKENEHRADSPSQRADMNGQLPPTHLEDGSELKTQDENAKNLEGKDAKVRSPTDLPETESLKHSEPVNNTTISDEAAAKETPRKSSQSHQGQVNGEVQPKSQEDRHELEFPNEDKENLEEKDAVPSHTGLEKSESSNQAEQVSSSSVSSEVVGKENEQRADSPSQRAHMNGQLPPTSQPDEQELKALEENVRNLEGTYSHHSLSKILPITEFLEHLEPDSKTTVSDEGAEDGDTVPPDGSQGQFSQSSKKGTRSVMQCAPEKDSQHEKRLQAESLEDLDPGHKTIAAHVGVQGEVEHHLDSPPPEYLKQFSRTSEREEGGKSIDMLIQYWEEKRKQHPEDAVHEGSSQHAGSQILECPKEFSKAHSNRLSRRGSRSGAEHLESPHNQGNLSKQSSDIDAAGQNTNIPHSESYEGPKEAEGEKVTPANLTCLHQTRNEIFGVSGFREAEQEWDFPKLNGDGLHSAGDEKPGASEDANPTHPLNGVTDQDSQNKRQASRSLKDIHKGNSARPSSASSEDEFQHQEGTSPGETKYAMNSDRHQEMEGKKKQDGLHDKQTQHGDQEDHYSRNTGLLPLNLEDLNRVKGTKPPNAGSEDQFEHQDDPYRDHGKGEKLKDSFIEKQIYGGASDPEECFPNSENLEEFLTRNGYKKDASNSAHGNGSKISSSHDQGKAGSTCLWDRVSTHDIGEDKTGHLYRDHSQQIGHSYHTEHSHRTGLRDHTNRGEEAARAEETSAWKLGFMSVPHIVAVGALTALSVLGKAAN